MSTTTTVLLIDGSQEDRHYWAGQLRTCSNDYQILEASDGETGLAICRSHLVDCVLLEICLPDMSGFQVLDRLIPRPYLPERAVIVLARLLLPPMDRLARHGGAQAYLVKSDISAEDLDKAIQRAVAAIHKNRGPTGDADRLIGNDE
jgi:CheY-like chemotaxis protein